MTAQTILPANSVVDTGLVTNSLRFNDGSSDFLSRSISSTGNRRKWTFSAWVKRSSMGTGSIRLMSVRNGNEQEWIGFDENDIHISRYNNSYIYRYITNRKFRDPSAFYHVCVAMDSEQSTAGNRMKLYVNGVQETSFSTETQISEDYNTSWNTASFTNYIGNNGNSGDYYDGYMSEVALIDGQQLAPTSFGEFDSDSPSIWKPIDVSGLTFGDNGFYLQFKGSGTSANSSGMGADTSGNDNHLTVNNLTAIDQSLDTCTNNHCTQNPIDTDANVVLSEGNLKVSNANNSYYSSCGTLAPVKGRWYFEAKVVSLGVFNVGITKATQDGTVHAQVDAGRVAYSSNGNLYDDSGDPLSDTSTTFGANDIIGVFLDLESGTQAVHFQKNGADVVSRNLADSYSGYTGGFKAAFGMGENDTTSGLINFGAPPFAISSSNSDANGYGDFEYSPVRSSLNYYTLNTKNLAEFG